MQRLHTNRRPLRQRALSTCKRIGTVIVETAVIAPVFGMFLAAMMEFGHAYMVINTLNSSAKSAARLGALEGVTNAMVEVEARKALIAAFDDTEATVVIKNAAVFDSASPPTDTFNYSSLPNYSCGAGDAGELFIVRITVPYDNVALLPPFWAKNLTLRGQSVARHE